MTKALILGARPSPNVGPWVICSDGDLWECHVPATYTGRVALEIDREGVSSEEVLDGSPLHFSGDRVRASILGVLPVDTVNVTIKQVA
jgi:hypothetical protein